MGAKVAGQAKGATIRPSGGVRVRKPNTFYFADDGQTPNNPRWPLIIYRSPIKAGPGADAAEQFEKLFASHGWRRAWRDGIYPYLHFHTHTHEVLGVARGRARVQFGGVRGATLELRAGDVAVLPAGTGHRRRSASRDLLVIGAYPAGGRYDEPKPEDVSGIAARKAIAGVGKPNADPVYGRSGPPLEVWSSTARRTRKEG